MGRLSLAALALCGAWTISSTGAAQEDWPEEEAWPELEPQAQQPATPAQGTPGQQPYPASYGQPAAAQTPAEPPPPSLLETSTHLFDLMAVFGFTTDESFDDALRAHGYGPSPDAVFGADVTSLWRVLPVLWVGGRLGYRFRSWEQRGSGSVDAYGIGLWLLVDLRLPLGRVWDIGLAAGAGGALVGLYVNDAADYHPAPAAYGGISMGVKLAGPVRAYTRFGYEYLQATSIDDWDHDINLSGGSFGVGVEIRR